MKREFAFTEAGPLIECIKRHKEALIGQKILHYYRDSITGTGESPAVFVVGDYAIIIYYYWYSTMNVVVVDKETFYKDTSLHFLYEDIPESSSVHHTEYRLDDYVDFVGKRIKRIEVERFSDAFEDCETIRPKGGDYFKTITVFMSNGKHFHICGEDAMYDGYMNVYF